MLPHILLQIFHRASICIQRWIHHQLHVSVVMVCIFQMAVQRLFDALDMQLRLREQSVLSFYLFFSVAGGG